ncbi:disulfide bond formation protein B [Parvularcula lutaonensis]|uniref:Disulfide bond formation protein B n=1 Tax=Parvularcula lutaonensis TaxID=491923 RepID=A0ABV7MD17_9PROT|nr:disulfide bond formation protein B [Parvularcula lutaonensis]GGY40175.1 disulfide bond formation protein B [Parvularcula lutaonensis]
MTRGLERLSDPKIAIGVCAGVSFSLIAAAHAFERIAGLTPCLLCLDQREVHWAAIGVAILAIAVMMLARGGTRIFAAFLGAMVLLYLFSAGLAGYHAGVEWGFWPGPNECAGGGRNADLTNFVGSDLLSSLEEPAAGPSCSEAAWRLFGISMAGYNALISLMLAGVAGLSFLRAAKGLRNDRVGSPAIAE